MSENCLELSNWGTVYAMKYQHQCRYIKAKKSHEIAKVEVLSSHEVTYRGNRYDLTTEKKTGKFPGFLPTLDGRFLQWVTGQLQIVHRDGRIVDVQVTPVQGPPMLTFVGSKLVGASTAKEPFFVVDTNTGALDGRLSDQQPMEINGMHLFMPALAANNDGRHLWTSETKRLVCFDVEQRISTQIITPPTDHVLLNVVRLSDGSIASLLRPSENMINWDRSRDAIIVYDSLGKERWRRSGSPIQLGSVGKNLVVINDQDSCFVVFSPDGEVLSTVPMFEPRKAVSMQLLGLPDGNGWIAVGGHGEWDHYCAVS